MVMTGPVSEWESWTDMVFPETGNCVVPLGLVDIDRAKDTGDGDGQADFDAAPAWRDENDIRRPATSSGEGERRIAVSDQEGRVRVDTQPPAGDADHEVEQSPRVSSGDQDREPRDDDHEEGSHGQHDEDNEVRDCEQPLH
jgi:hypothetical protein